MISNRELGRQRLRNLNPRPGSWSCESLEGGVRYSKLESVFAGLNLRGSARISREQIKNVGQPIVDPSDW